MTEGNFQSLDFDSFFIKELEKNNENILINCIRYLRIFLKGELFLCHFHGVLMVADALLDCNVSLGAELLGIIKERIYENIDAIDASVENEMLMCCASLLKKIDKQNKLADEIILDMANRQNEDGGWGKGTKSSCFAPSIRIATHILQNINCIRNDDILAKIEKANDYINNIWEEDIKSGEFIPFKAAYYLLLKVKHAKVLDDKIIDDEIIRNTVLTLLNNQLDCGGWSYFRYDRNNSDFLNCQSSIADTMVITCAFNEILAYITDESLKKEVLYCVKKSVYYLYGQLNCSGWTASDNFTYARYLSWGIRVANNINVFSKIQYRFRAKIC